MNSTNLAAAESKNFLIPNGTFFVELIIFLFVLAVIWKFVVPPIRKVLEEREAMVAKTSEDNHKAARAFADAESTYRDELAGARSEAGRIRDEARADGQHLLDEKRAAARAESEEIQGKAADDLGREGAQVSDRLRAGVGPLSETLANRVLGVETVKSGVGSNAPSGQE